MQISVAKIHIQKSSGKEKVQVDDQGDLCLDMTNASLLPEKNYLY